MGHNHRVKRGPRTLAAAAPPLLLLLLGPYPLVPLASAQPPPAPPCAGGVLDLKLVDPTIVASHQAACLDGSPPGYYVLARDPSPTAPWIISLEGGAWCWQLEEDPTNAMASCVDRSTMYLGTSTGIPNTTSVCGGGVLAPNATTNPVFSGFNVAYVHYCDGSFFSSSNPAPVPVPSSPSTLLHFRGRPNLAAVLDDLVASYNLATATEVVLHGASAGAQAVYFQGDWIRGEVLSPNRFPGMMVTAIPDSGFFLDAGDFATGTHQYRGRLNSAEPLWQALASGTLDSTCLAANPGAAAQNCYFPQNSAPFFSTPLFALNSAVDAEQMFDDLQVGCCPLVNCSKIGPHTGPPCNASQMQAILAYGQEFLADFVPTLQGRPGVGAFIPMCYNHVIGSSDNSWLSFSIPNGQGGRTTMSDAVGTWYGEIRSAFVAGEGRGGVDADGEEAWLRRLSSSSSSFTPVQLVDGSEIFPSNPSCPYPPPPPPL
jgi:hypothetical protein